MAKPQRTRWDQALRDGDHGELAAAAEAFGRLTAEVLEDADAWFNRGLCLAWSGRDQEAIECLDQVVNLEAEGDFKKASEAWLLAELLRQGGGAENLSDDLRFACTFAWTGDQTARLESEFPELRRIPTPRDPTRFEGERRRARGPRVARQAVPRSRGGAQPGRAPPGPGHRLHLARIAPALQPSRGDPGRSRREAPEADRGGDAAGGTRGGPPALAVPRRGRLDRADPFGNRPGAIARACPRDRRGVLREPVDPPAPAGTRRTLSSGRFAGRAAGDAVARAKLDAVVRLREQLGSRPTAVAMYQGYPFDRLRRRLGLDPVETDTVDAGDLSCASLSELEALDARRARRPPARRGLRVGLRAPRRPVDVPVRLRARQAATGGCSGDWTSRPSMLRSSVTRCSVGIPRRHSSSSPGPGRSGPKTTTAAASTPGAPRSSRGPGGPRRPPRSTRASSRLPRRPPRSPSMPPRRSWITTIGRTPGRSSPRSRARPLGRSQVGGGPGEGLAPDASLSACVIRDRPRFVRRPRTAWHTQRGRQDSLQASNVACYNILLAASDPLARPSCP